MLKTQGLPSSNKSFTHLVKDVIAAPLMRIRDRQCLAVAVASSVEQDQRPILKCRLNNTIHPKTSNLGATSTCAVQNKRNH